ncbi:polysaccharide biosynthesis protein (plasmid) [Pseudorhodobacter turbinis]|uniref:Polysaccharide biosynthesis protein n=1 Tax=Pseudorhodobacter turbinis TaxID=2500533 RepID=A0A4P8EJY7_9RHOB|nr:oligosaccharide flippase family protein [Pseudorhodobacter turbinis]QCO57182.1 polysaccharide biosynthesis protein [Pseudorhodobacter turbinis]
MSNAGLAGKTTGIWGRAARGSAWIAMSFVAAQGFRLISNLILTRLLFPEAFGIMALVTVLLVGLMLFSDMGVGPAIMQSQRGDEPDFLNTAWTIQILRGGILWVLACGLAYPAALFYDQPLIGQILPVASLALVFAGFEPTRIHTANRHLLLGRVTVLDLISTLLGIAVMLVLAYITRSVWSLALGSVATAALRLVLMTAFMPGDRNRLRWEKMAGSELLHFGFWIFLSSVCGFLVSQGDKAVLGKFLSIEGLGIYNIGAFLAMFPIMLGSTVTARVLIPIYREHTEVDPVALARLVRLRRIVTGGLILGLAVLALAGPFIVNLLYDVRYSAAGGVMVAICSVQMIVVIFLTYDQAALARGDSRGFFVVSAAKAGLQTAGFVIGALYFGLAGAMLGQAVAMLIYMPVIARLAWRHGVWDAAHDVIFLAVALILGALAVWVNWPQIELLFPGSGGGFYGP